MSFTKQVILVCKYCVKPGKTGDNLRTYKYLQNLRIHAGMIHKMEVDIVDDELNWTDMKEDRYNKLAKSQELKGMNDKDRRREKKLKHNRDLIESLSMPLDLCVDVGADADTGAPIQSTSASTSSDMDTGILDTSDWDMIITTCWIHPCVSRIHPVDLKTRCTWITVMRLVNIGLKIGMKIGQVWMIGTISETILRIFRLTSY